MSGGGVGVFTPPGLIRSGSDQTNLSLNGLPPDLALKAEHINRRQHIADLLLQQGTQPIQGQMAGRFYVAPSWAQGIAQLAKAGAGAYATYKNNEALQELGDQHQQHLVNSVKQYLDKTSPTPAQPGSPMEVEAQGPGAPVANPVGSVDPSQVKQNYLASAGFDNMTPEGQRDPQATADARARMQQTADALEKGAYDRQRGLMTEGARPTATVMSPDIPSQPKTPEEMRAATVEFLTSGHPAAHALVQMQQHGEQLKAAQDFQAKEHALTREQTSAEKALDRENRLQVSDGQLNNMVMLGLMKQEDADKMRTMQAENAKRHDETMAQNQRLHDERTAVEKERDRKNDIRIKQMEVEQKQEAATTGKVPPGYRQTPDGNLAAIPGGPADLKLQGALNQDTSTLQSSTASMDRLASTANELLNHKGLAGITGLRGAIPNLPGSNAADAQAQLDSLKSKVGFGVLQEMRNNSKTGGALGAISDKENVLLQNNLEALDKAQSLEAMQKALRGIITYSDEAKGRLRNAYNMKHGEKGAAAPTQPPSNAPAKITSDADYNALPSGSTFIAPDGTTRKKP